MLTISKALNSGQAQTYHQMEFTSSTQSYYKQDGAVAGEWQGQLADKMGLTGAVSPEHFTRLDGRPAPRNRRADGEAPDRPGVQEPGRNDHQHGRTSGRLGRYIFRSQVRFAHGFGGRRRASTGGPRRRCDRRRGRAGALHPGQDRRQQPRRDDGQTHCCQVRARHCPPRRRLRRASAPHPCLYDERDRTGRRNDPRPSTSKPMFDSQNYATAVYQSVLTYKLRDLGYEIEAGKERSAGNQGLLSGLFRRFQPQVSADQRAPCEDRLHRCGSVSDCRPRDPRQESNSFPGTGLGGPPEHGRVVRQPAGNDSGRGSPASPGHRTGRPTRKPGQRKP